MDILNIGSDVLNKIQDEYAKNEFSDETHKMAEFFFKNIKNTDEKYEDVNKKNVIEAMIHFMRIDLHNIDKQLNENLDIQE